uniref:Mannitol dehydrogenase putative n=1 Tax=Albugo laibachii Nc14 TaxID=890382 RepID=F0WXJ8_9STRA|nr:mannitol dehydrogenase putative [Albugo laibachii Nc14]|eukprot:CCA26192.1 mannitol dehydrogenase putative [Albugo laibachii Nc14]
MSSTRTVHALAAFESEGDMKPWSYESRPLGPEDIEIEITHCGICGSDIHTIDSGWGATNYPLVPGHEIVGKVTEVGPDVNKFKVGDRVGVGAQVWACLNKDASKSCHECKVGMDALCSSIVATYNGKYRDGSLSYGGYADYVCVIQDYAFTIPENIPSDEAAPLLCAGATVYTPLKHEGVESGDRVGVVGIGGLGHLAIQFIAALGAIPVAFSRSSSKEKEVRALGAQEFIATDDKSQVESASRSLDYLLITADANGMPYDQYLGFLRPRGTCIMLGIPNDNITFRALSLISPAVRLVGSLIGSINDIKEMLEVASVKNVRPVIQKMPMKQVNDGIALVRSGKVRYRVVLEN